MSCFKWNPSRAIQNAHYSSKATCRCFAFAIARLRELPRIVLGPGGPRIQAAASLHGLPCADRLRRTPTSLCGPSSGAGCKPRCLQTTSRMSSQPEDGWHGGSGSGDGQAPPAGNAAGDAAFPNPREPIQGAEGVLPATAPTQRTPGAVGPLQLMVTTHTTEPAVAKWLARGPFGLLF